MDNDFPQILKKMKPLISLIPYNIIAMYNPVIMRNIMLLYRIPHSVRPNFFYISLYINKIYRQLFYFKVTHLSRSLSFPLSAFLAILILFPPRWISQRMVLRWMQRKMSWLRQQLTLPLMMLLWRMQ
ncbi:uncharacterized protein LOC125203318 [Salvia hispanica]|uniref:uncharacterized protein LOC125203318 n=1 Tax=Salvia hispanica TaxID=49212 RepID=UPI0020098176|nr:uncharacterized protein LOC125203318 [Salvia hispanica]